jgi:F0F1-type ATP synthase assembly protein I
MVDSIAFRQWKQDIARSLMFQWALLIMVCGACAVFGWDVAFNALVIGLAIAIPNTALGAWMGVRLMLGRVSPFGVFIGGIVKTLFSVVLIGAAFAALQEFGWVWQGFFAGLVSMVFSPALFGLTIGRSA